MDKRISQPSLLLVLVGIALLALVGGRDGFPVTGSLWDGGFPESLERHVRDSFPFAQRLEQTGVGLRLMGGNREQNGIYIGQDMLLRNIDTPNADIVADNSAAVLAFARYCRYMDKTVAFTLIPTSGAVVQQQLPRYAHPYPQRQFIDSNYSRMSGQLLTVDSFSVLSARRDQYIFYRTENNLTATGGYHIYAAVAARLLGETPSLSQYDIEYISGDFYGDLYHRSPYKNVVPDMLAVYRYSRHVREYTVTHTDSGGERQIYHTLYPLHTMALAAPTDLYLGGISPVMDIRSSAPYDRSLLLFSDKTALSIVPFLANHYKKVTVIDLSGDPSLFEDISAEDYDQVLIAYSVETYASTSIPSRITLFVEE